MSASSAPLGRGHRQIEVDLVAVILAISQSTPKILVVRGDGAGGLDREGLPEGSLDPDEDRTLELGMRRWVRDRTGIELGYLEQLYTFGDRDREASTSRRVLSIVYLALVREQPVAGPGAPEWRSCYEYFPWEDRREAASASLDGAMRPALLDWAAAAERREGRETPGQRVSLAFGSVGAPFEPTRVLDRYELLYEARLLPEARETNEETTFVDERDTFGRPMRLDHRRIAATAFERVRGKLAYRPLVFELLPEEFTLLQLQRAVEALFGLRLHKPNFRRLIEQAQLVEGTGRREARTGGRPAELYRFRREVVRERPAPGVALPGRRRRHP